MFLTKKKRCSKSNHFFKELIHENPFHCTSEFMWQMRFLSYVPICIWTWRPEAVIVWLQLLSTFCFVFLRQSLSEPGAYWFIHAFWPWLSGTGLQPCGATHVLGTIWTRVLPLLQWGLYWLNHFVPAPNLFVKQKINVIVTIRNFVFKL